MQAVKTKEIFVTKKRKGSERRERRRKRGK